MELQSLAQHSTCAVCLRTCQLIRRCPNSTCESWRFQRNRTIWMNFPHIVILFYIILISTKLWEPETESKAWYTTPWAPWPITCIGWWMLFDASLSPSTWGDFGHLESMLDSFDVQISLQDINSHTCPAWQRKCFQWYFGVILCILCI